MAEVKKTITASDVIKVKNVSNGPIYTSKGVIEEGKSGQATIAELQTSQGKLEKV